MNTVEQTVRLLYNAVKKASVSSAALSKGDLVVITGNTDDTVGIINDLQIVNNTITAMINTVTGTKSICLSNDRNFIHLIKRADMLNLRDHTDYERDLKDMSKEKHGYQDGHAERPEYGPTMDSKKSELPTSKISLNLRRNKKDN